MAAAAGLAVIGFLAYYVPVYRAPQLFPAATVTVPVLGPCVCRGASFSGLSSSRPSSSRS